MLLQPRKINSGSVLLFMNVRQRVDVAAISDRTLSYDQVSFFNFSPVPCLHKPDSFFNSFLVIPVALQVIEIAPHGRISRSIFEDVNRNKPHKVLLNSKSAIVIKRELQEMVYQG